MAGCIEAGASQVSGIARTGSALELGNECRAEDINNVGVLVLMLWDKPAQVGLPVLTASEDRPAEGNDDRLRRALLPDFYPQLRRPHPFGYAIIREARPTRPSRTMQH